MSHNGGTGPSASLAMALGGGTNNLSSTSVASAGDINGDGYTDVVVGANGGAGAGAVYVYLGTKNGLPSSPTTTLSGPSATSYFGCSVDGAGDINGDGYDDIVVGADGGNGAAYVYLGGASGLSTTPSITFQGPTANGDFGISVAGAGDVNRDGFADVIVGASGVNNSDGAAYLYLGSASGFPSSPSSTLNSIGQAGTFGKVVASARIGVVPPQKRGPYE